MEPDIPSKLDIAQRSVVGVVITNTSELEDSLVLLRVGSR